jgi:tRNA(fMet)-specific endonuclease VapC
MLDTNIVGDFIKNPAGKVAQRLKQLGEGAVCTSIVVAAELRYGCSKKRSPKLLEKVNELLPILPVIPFEQPADSHYGDIRATLEMAGQTIGMNDLLIAAHARSLSLIIVTANDGEFRRIDRLQVENWLE